MAGPRSDSGSAVGLRGRSGSPFTWVQLSFSLNFYNRSPSRDFIIAGYELGANVWIVPDLYIC